MKHLIITAILVLIALFSFGQEHDQELEILVTDSTWTKEIIKFPFGFAPTIPFKGYEDLRFANGWKNPESDEFFSYAFVWNINLDIVPTVSGIENDMLLYYDGLMTAVNKDKDFTIPKTNAKFSKKKTEKQVPSFTGTMKVYDSFFTKKVITLYVDVETLYCDIQKRYMLFFKVSTQTFDKVIWQKFETIKLKDNYCEYKP